MGEVEYVRQGRPPGSRNRRTKEIFDLLRARGDKDPVDFLSEVVTNANNEHPVDLRAASRPKGRVCRSSPAASTPRYQSSRSSERRIHGAPGGRRNLKNCLRPMSRPSRSRTSSITTTSCSTGRRWLATPASPTTSVAASITSWSTTPTACSPRSCWR